MAAGQEVGNGYVKISAQMDDNAAQQLEQSGKGIGSGFGTAFSVAAGNLISGALSTIAGSVADVFSNAFDNFADYEQLVGGVETLFKESASIVQQNAAAAYRTAGLSANEYMEQVTSFSASLLQGLGGDTEKAAAYADMAMRDMSDNANKMGTSMESITTAYQGFAKQNYTMLDNLKLGYGGTKTEMERLLKDASAIAGVEFNIDNYNDVIEAIHVMQEQMGIAGTTSKEATETISGSITKLQGSWQNFLTGVFDENADLGALGEQLLDSVGDVMRNVIPRIGTLVVNLFTGLPGAIVDVFRLLPATVAPTINAILGDEIGGQVNAIFDDTCGAIQQTIEGAISVIQGIIETAWPVIENIIETAMQAVDAFMTQVWPHIQQLISSVMNVVTKIIQTAWPIITSIVDGAMKAIKGVVDFVWPAISAAIGLAIDTIDAAVRSLEPLVSFIGGIFDGIKAAMEDPIGAAQRFISDALSTIQGIFDGLDFSLPHIALPHFNIYGGEFPWGIGGQGRAPEFSVDWYAKGGFVDGATLIGAGENGAEMILPQRGELLQDFAEAIADEMGGGITVENMTVVTQDPEDFMRQLTAFAARTRAQYA